MIAQPAAVVEYVLTDSTASIGYCRFSLPYGTSRAAAESKADTMRGILAGLTGCAIVEQNIIYHRGETGNVYAAPGANRQLRGIFIFEDSASDLYQIDIPGFDDTLTETTGPLAGIAIDTTLPDVDAFVQDCIATWRTDEDIAITALSDAFVQEIG